MVFVMVLQLAKLWGFAEPSKHDLVQTHGTSDRTIKTRRETYFVTEPSNIRQFSLAITWKWLNFTRVRAHAPRLYSGCA